MFQTIDLHCDLLFYLAHDKQRTPNDIRARCSIPQLHQGNVKLQTMAVFTKTGLDSAEKGLQQIKIFEDLPTHFPKDFILFSLPENFQSSQIAIRMAFENASGFCNESEPLQTGLNRLKKIIQTGAKPLYISLTWNSENRFGGGALEPKGLKPDGKHLLDVLHQQSIALDLSHASDALAYEAIDYIEGKGLKIPIMASHSNARAVRLVPRNLPDDIAKEIFRRGGIIGLNLFRTFVGETNDELVKHISHWLELGGENHVSFGADFFYEPDLPIVYKEGKEVFFKDYQDASCYGKLLSFMQKELKLNNAILEKVSHKNAFNFLQHHIL